MIDQSFDFDRELSAASLPELLKQFPALPANVLLALAVLTLLDRSVTPWRVCGCGCGDPIHGKARFASPSCRKRLERERSAAAADSPKQFGLVLQLEIAVPIPAVTVRARSSRRKTSFPPQL